MFLYEVNLFSLPDPVGCAVCVCGAVKYCSTIPLCAVTAGGPADLTVFADRTTSLW